MFNVNAFCRKTGGSCSIKSKKGLNMGGISNLPPLESFTLAALKKAGKVAIETGKELVVKGIKGDIENFVANNRSGKLNVDTLTEYLDGVNEMELPEETGSAAGAAEHKATTGAGK